MARTWGGYKKPSNPYDEYFAVGITENQAMTHLRSIKSDTRIAAPKTKGTDMEFELELDIGDQVWVMFENKPEYGVVTEISLRKTAKGISGMQYYMECSDDLFERKRKSFSRPRFTDHKCEVGFPPQCLRPFYRTKQELLASL